MTPESSRMESSGPVPMPGPSRALTPALAPPPVSPAPPPGASAALSRQCCLTAGTPKSSVGCGAFALAAGRCISMPERGNGAADVGAVECLMPISGCSPSVPPAQAASSQERGTMALAPLDSQSPAVEAQAPHPSTAGGDSFSWAPHCLGEPLRGTSLSTENAALGSVEGSGAVGGGALVGGGAASPPVPCATGSSGFDFGDSEPWSMMGSFEVLLSGSLPADLEEEAPLASSSRFARFFDADDAAVSKPPRKSCVFSGSLAAGGVHGSKLDGEVRSGIGGGSKLLDDDWQQGFRALLPDVNISFSSPFGDHALSGGRPNAEQLGGLGGGLGGISSFSGFGASGVDGPQQIATSGVGASCTVGNGGGGNGGGSLLHNGSLLHAPLNGVALPGLAGDSGAATPNTLLQQLSVGSLPGAQLSTMAGPKVRGPELSSQLHSLLHGGGAGGAGGAAGAGGAGGAGGAAGAGGAGGTGGAGGAGGSGGSGSGSGSGGGGSGAGGSGAGGSGAGGS